MHIKDFDPYDFSKKEIDGVTVYYKNLPWSPCIHIRFNFSVGAFNDPKDKEGVAHFLEHMIGNGSPLLPDKKAIKEFSRLYMLNSRNAMTSYNWTAYVGKCLPEHFEKVFSTMRSYVFEPFLRDIDIEHERKVITQEAWGRYKNDKFLNYVKECSQNIYHGHERSRIYSPLGWPVTVAAITQKDVTDFHNVNYIKENLSIFIVGAVEDQHLLLLEDLIKDIPSGSKTKIDEGKIGKPTKNRFEKTGEEIGDPKEQLEYNISRSINRLSEDEVYAGHQAAGLLYDILFEKLRIEHSLCYGVDVGWRNYKDFSEMSIGVETSEDKLSLVEKEIWGVINEIIDNKWEERFNTLHKLKIDQIRSNERSTYDIIYNAAIDLINTEKIETLEKIIIMTEKVTYKDVCEFIKKIFDPEYVFTEVILPSKK
ncbi:insulinase family protein [Patescibacteria group bacterium]|nr:insulinase family protein [Patescibacteria group bacterium]